MTIELQEATYLCDPPEHRAWHIVKWYPNEYYGKEHEYIRCGVFYTKPDDPNFKIHKSCFKHRMLNVAIAEFEWVDGYYEFKYIADRPLRLLTSKDYEAFRRVVKQGFEQLNGSRIKLH